MKMNRIQNETKPQIPNHISAYILNEKVYEDNISSIYKVTNKYTQTQCTSIIYSKELSYNSISSIHREIFNLKMLKHRNILSLYEVIESKSHIYLFTELKKGKELFEHITLKNRLSEKEALAIFQQVIDAMKYMHKMTIAHRDIRPENITIDSTGMIKLINFTSSIIYNKFTLLQDNRAINAYSCPEIILQKGYSGVKSDVWSCGVLLYSMVCGFLPFWEQDEEKNKEMIIKGDYLFPEKGISPQIKDLIKSMLEVDPMKRYDFYQVISHPWFNSDKPTLTNGLNILEYKYPIDKRILTLCTKYGFDQDKLTQELMNNNMTHGTAVYMLCIAMILENNKMSCSDLCSKEFIKYLEVQKNQYTVMTIQKRYNEMVENEKRIINMIQKEEKEVNAREEESIAEIDKLIENNKALNKEDVDNTKANDMFSVVVNHQRSKSVFYKCKPTFANILNQEELKLEHNSFFKKYAKDDIEEMEKGSKRFEQFKNESFSNDSNINSKIEASNINNKKNPKNEYVNENSSEIDVDVGLVSNSGNDKGPNIILQRISEDDIDIKSDSESRRKSNNNSIIQTQQSEKGKVNNNANVQLELFADRILYEGILSNENQKEVIVVAINEIINNSKRAIVKDDDTEIKDNPNKTEDNPALVLSSNAVIENKERIRVDKISNEEQKPNDKNDLTELILSNDNNNHDEIKQTESKITIDNPREDYKENNVTVKKEDLNENVVNSIIDPNDRGEHEIIRTIIEHQPISINEENSNKDREDEVKVNQAIFEYGNDNNTTTKIMDQKAIEPQLHSRNNSKEVNNSQLNGTDSKSNIASSQNREIEDQAVNSISNKSEDKKDQSTVVQFNDITINDICNNNNKKDDNSHQNATEVKETRINAIASSPSQSPHLKNNEVSNIIQNNKERSSITQQTENQVNIASYIIKQNKQIKSNKSPSMRNKLKKLEFSIEEIPPEFLTHINKTSKTSRENSKINKNVASKPLMTHLQLKKQRNLKGNDDIGAIKANDADNHHNKSFVKIGQIKQSSEIKAKNTKPILKKTITSVHNSNLKSSNSKQVNSTKVKDKDKDKEKEKAKQMKLKNTIGPLSNPKAQQTTSPMKPIIENKIKRIDNNKKTSNMNNSIEIIKPKKNNASFIGKDYAYNDNDNDNNTDLDIDTIYETKEYQYIRASSPNKKLSQPKIKEKEGLNKSLINQESQLKDILRMRINEKKDKKVHLKSIKEKKAVIKPLMMLNSKTLFVTSSHKQKTNTNEAKHKERRILMKNKLSMGSKSKPINKNNSQEKLHYVATESTIGKMVNEDTIESTGRTLNPNNFLTARSLSKKKNANDDCDLKKSAKLPKSSKNSSNTSIHYKYTTFYQNPSHNANANANANDNSIAIENINSLTLSGNMKDLLPQTISYSGPINIVCIASTSLIKTINNLILKLKANLVSYNEKTKLNYACWKDDLSFEVDIVELEHSYSLNNKLYYYLVKIEEGVGDEQMIYSISSLFSD